MQTMIVLLALLSLTATTLSWADVVELKTGQRVEGTFKRATPAGVVIEVGGQTITFDQDKVRAIYFGPAPASQVHSTTLEDALGALKGLRSVTIAGTTYNDYVRRVGDLKILVDKYLETPERDDSRIRWYVTAAMRQFELAIPAWKAKIAGTNAIGSREKYIEVGSDPAIRDCQAVRELLGDAAAAGEIVTTPFGAGRVISNSFSKIWACTAESIREAEKALASMPARAPK